MKVLLVDDHALFSKSLEIALSDFTEIDQFFSIDKIADISKTIALHKPDIILMDINLSNIDVEDGLILSKKIIKKYRAESTSENPNRHFKRSNIFQGRNGIF